MTYSELVSKAIWAEGMELETVRGKPFRVSVFMDCPYFIPLSTGLGRSDGKKAAARCGPRLHAWRQCRKAPSSAETACSVRTAVQSPCS